MCIKKLKSVWVGGDYHAKTTLSSVAALFRESKLQTLYVLGQHLAHSISAVMSRLPISHLPATIRLTVIVSEPAGVQV